MRNSKTFFLEINILQAQRWKAYFCLAVCLTRVLLKAFIHSKKIEIECIFCQIEFIGASFWNMSKNINLKTGKVLCVIKEHCTCGF
jgi:hypothetical protein